jgi:SPP1 gp7 family putative phage head morphogenesis protein
MTKTEIIDNDAISIEPISIDLAKDTAVNMALRVLFTQIFTPYSVVSLEGKELSKNIIDEVSNIIDQHMKDLQLAFSDFLLRGKCYLYRFNYLNPLSVGFKEFKHYNKEKGRIEYCIKYTVQKPHESNWWEDEEAEEVQVVIAPAELKNKFPSDVEFYDEKYLGVYHNPIPIHETIQQIADQKNTLSLKVMPLMTQKALIPTIVGITSNTKAGQVIKTALSNHQNRTRVYIPAAPDEVKLETISIGKDIPTNLIETMLYYYDSAIFMGLGTSISIVKASGQELTTSRTVDRNILRIVQGYQQEIERWIYDQLTKLGYNNVWVKFANPDPDWELNMLEKIKMIKELQQGDETASYDFSSVIERILPTNEYGEILASYPDLTEEEAEKARKYAEQGKKGLEYITDEDKLKELDKKKKQLEKIISKLENVGDKFGKKSMDDFVNWIKETYERYGYEGMMQNWDELLRSFTKEEMDIFFLDYVAPALNSLKIYDDLDQQTIDLLKQHWEQAFYNIYSSYSQQFLDVLTDGVQKGLGEDEIVRNLKKVAGDVKGQRLQLRAREEINKTYNLSRAKKFWNDKVVYITMEDERVRPSHKKLHGMVFVPAEHPELVPPLGYNCRCTITPYRGE